MYKLNHQGFPIYKLNHQGFGMFWSLGKKSRSSPEISCFRLAAPMAESKTSHERSDREVAPPSEKYVTSFSRVLQCDAQFKEMWSSFFG